MVYLDMSGDLVKRPKDKYPNSYDPFRVYIRMHGAYDKTIDSDKMYIEDRERFNNACSVIFGNTSTEFYDRKPWEIEIFLIEWFDKNVVLTGIEECCNKQTGATYWRFHYR